MSRLWIGIGIMVVLLAAGIVFLCLSNDFYQDITADLEQAGQAAMDDNWQTAGQKMRESQKKWHRYRRFLSAITDHEPVEEMDSLFAQLQLYEQRRLNVDFAVICQSLSHLAEAIDESHNLKWWSIL